MYRSSVIVAAILVGLGITAAAAADATVGALTISVPWSRAMPKGATVGGGYMTVTNGGVASDRLIGGTVAGAEKVELHEMSMDNGVMKMRPLASGIEIAPGQTVKLTPGGMHMMFVGLKQPLEQGQTFKVTLQFEKAGKVDVDFLVAGMGAQAPGDTNMNAMPGNMPGMGGMKKN